MYLGNLLILASNTIPESIELNGRRFSLEEPGKLNYDKVVVILPSTITSSCPSGGLRGIEEIIKQKLPKGFDIIVYPWFEGQGCIVESMGVGDADARIAVLLFKLLLPLELEEKVEIDLVSTSSWDIVEAVYTALKVTSATLGLRMDINTYIGVNDGGVLRGGRALSERLEPIHAAYTIALDVLRLSKSVQSLKLVEDLEDVVEKRWGDKIRQVFEHGIVSAYTIVYGMPLAAVYHGLEAGGCGTDVLVDAVNILEDVLESFEASIERAGSKLRAKARLSYNGIYMLLASMALEMHVRRAYMEALGGEPPCRLEEVDDRGIYLDELEEIVRRLTPFPEHTLSLIKTLKNSFDRAACVCESDGTEPVCKGSVSPPMPLYCGDWPGVACETVDKVKLLGEAGLSRELVEATIDVGGLALRYRDGCWEFIKKSLVGG